MPGHTLCLHIGLPKTASTHLQTSVFPRFEGIDVFDRPTNAAFRSAEDRARGQRVMTAMVQRDPRVWAKFGGSVFDDMLGPPEARSPRDILISDEGIGRAGSRPDLLAAHLEAIRRAARPWGIDRLRVICALRRQDRWFASHYAQISDHNPVASQADFEDAARRLVDPTGERFRLGMMLDYGALLDRIVGAVGRENLFVYPFERKDDDPEAVYRAMAGFAGASWTPPVPGADETSARANVRSSGQDRWSIRRMAPDLRVLPYGLSRRSGLPHRVRRPRPLRARSFALTPKVSRTIMEAYVAGNARLARAFDLDLARFGYTAG